MLDMNVSKNTVYVYVSIALCFCSSPHSFSLYIHHKWSSSGGIVGALQQVNTATASCQCTLGVI